MFSIYFLIFSRLAKEQMETGKSQETLDNVGLQSSSVKEVDELEDKTGEGGCSLAYNHMLHIQQLVQSATFLDFSCLSPALAPISECISDYELVSVLLSVWEYCSDSIPCCCPSFCAQRW